MQHRGRSRAVTAIAVLSILLAVLPGGTAATGTRSSDVASLATTTVSNADGTTTTTTSLGGEPSPVTFGNAAAAGSTASSAAPVAPSFAEGRVIVRFRAGSSFLPGSGPARALVAGANVHLVDNPPGLSTAAALARYRANPDVVYAEPDYTVSAIALPNDYNSTVQWDMAKIAAPTAWDTHTDSSAVVVAVVDTGVMWDHPDLAANAWTNPDGTIHGYSCLNGSCIAGGYDDHGHGTHVAGTIGAVGDNGVGMAGINWKVRILPVKFLNSSGSGSISDAVLGFDLLRQLKVGGENIRVTNNSWGGGGYSQALKDAMLALETTAGAPSTINICAAGNSGVNADFSPMYPAAYDNRGIVSVLASDSNDAGASFTNYGYASVDLAAPGVNTYSTEATGTCSLCDPSGYRTLSGTSMASPHVAGVAAAMLAERPALTAAQARDALLRPASYDALSDAKAIQTSTGGRLNFAKVLANTTFYDNPVLNQFPSVTVGPDVFTTGGGTIAFSQTSSDPDGDPLRTATGRGAFSPSGGWMVENMGRQLFPLTASAPFTAPSLARMVAVPYATSVADGRGGGASARNWAVVSPVASPGGAPSGTLTVPATASVGVAVTIGFNPKDPEGGSVAWDMFVAYIGGNSGTCCFSGTSASVTFNSAGIYRIFTRAIDRELSLSTVATATIAVGGATTGDPAIPDVRLTPESGTSPLTVAVDMSGSVDHDGTIPTYFIGCGGGFIVGQSGPTGSCTFTEPGTYALLMHIKDSSGYLSPYTAYVTVAPPSGSSPDTTPPSVGFTSPTGGASVMGTVALTATASDAGSGVARVEFFLDSTAAAASLGAVTAAPYTVNWNADAASAGSHRLYAVAKDVGGNSAQAYVDVTVVRPIMPTVTLSPSGTIQIVKKSRLDLSAMTNTPTYGVARVEFLYGTTIICTDTVAPYTCSWTAPGAVKTGLKFQARVYDTRGNMALSAILTVNVR